MGLRAPPGATHGRKFASRSNISSATPVALPCFAPVASPLTLSPPIAHQSLPPRGAAVTLKEALLARPMVNSILMPSATEAARIELKRYNTTIPMGSLSIGVDNIHHDVFLSPRFVHAPRDYLFDLILQHH